MMIKEYISNDQDFSTRTSGTYSKLFFLVPLCSLAIVALGYAIFYHGGRHRRTKIERIIEGLSYMDTTSIFISLTVGILIMIGLLFFLKSYYRNREIVIALKFDDNSKQLTVRTQRIDGQEFVRTHKYAELLLEYNHLSDGMTPPMYNTLTLVKGNYLVGHIYLGHFTWDMRTVSEIKMKLRNVL
jgi:hypothetical protein